MRHDKLIKRFRHNLPVEESTGDLRLDMSDLVSCPSSVSFQASQPPFYFPFDLYNYLETNNIDDLVLKLRQFLSESDHSEEEWEIVLRWNNKELLRALSVRSDNVSEKNFDILLECLLLFVEINPPSICSPLVSSTLMSTLFQSLNAEDPLSLFKRLQLLYSLFNYGGQAFPDISYDNCQYLIDLCTHRHDEVRKLAITTCIVGYFRMSSDMLWRQLQDVLSFDCLENIISHAVCMLRSDDIETVNMEASLEWISCCFHYQPTLYYNLYNFQVTLDVLLDNLSRFLDHEELCVVHIQCLQRMMNWDCFFEANYRVNETLEFLNTLMAEGGKRNYSKICETISQILNDHLDRLEDLGKENTEGGDVVVYE